MSGGPVIPDAPSPSADEIRARDELMVTGSPFGSGAKVGVSPESIRTCATTVRGLAARVREDLSGSRLAAYSLGGTMHLTPVGPSALAQINQAVGEGEAVAADLDGLAGRLEAAALRYEAAEAASEAALWDIPRVPEWQRWLFPGVAVAHVASAVALALDDARDYRQWPWPTRHGAGMLLEETLWAATGIDEPIPVVGGAVAGALNSTVSDDVEVAQISGPGGTGQIRGLEGVANAVGDLYPNQGAVGPGTIRIDEVTQPDGSRGWVVVIPGAQDGWNGSNPLDWATTPESLVGMPTAGAAMVTQAMRMAGIKPGEQVLLAGHSQGGMIAANVASAVGSEFDVGGIVAFGSPVGLLDVPEGVEVLAVEHVGDPVPGLDNAANPVSEDFTTVSRNLTDSSDPEVAAWDSTPEAHGAEAYADTARLIEASDDPALRDFMNQFAPLLDGAGHSESRYYQGTRIP